MTRAGAAQPRRSGGADRVLRGAAGQLHGFRWKDWSDHPLGPASRRSRRWIRCSARGTAQRTEFALRKAYVSGGMSITVRSRSRSRGRSGGAGRRPLGGAIRSIPATGVVAFAWPRRREAPSRPASSSTCRCGSTPTGSGLGGEFPGRRGAATCRCGDQDMSLAGASGDRGDDGCRAWAVSGATGWSWASPIMTAIWHSRVSCFAPSGLTARSLQQGTGWPWTIPRRWAR
jgi:hypothetical protein